MQKPKARGSFRLKLGISYFTLKRYIQWYFSNTLYAKEVCTDFLEESPFQYKVYSHQSLLLRKLRNVDMWYQYNKVQNLKLAIPRLNGLIIRPGETMSYWRRIGLPTKRKGYLQGMELHGGGFRPAYGGGLCQLSNLIYWMTLHTPLTVVERFRHQYDVFPDSNRTQPFGSGATCSYNYIDLQIKNNTPYSFCLNLHLTETHLIGEWRTDHPIPTTYQVYEKNHRITQEYWGGYIRHNEIWRKVYNAEQELLEDEYITENHAIMMYSPLLSESS